MHEIDFELSRNAKETLSWMVVAELLKHVDGNKGVVMTYPYEGHYDCLTISNFNEQDQVLLNRLGTNALAHGELVEFIWERAAHCPRETAFHIMSEATLPAGDGAQVNLGAIIGATRIAQFLAEDISESGDVTWGWASFLDEDTEHHLLSEFEIPPEWKTFQAPTESTSWTAWIWILTNKNGLQAVVNLKTGEMLDKAGNPWNKWKNSPLKDDLGYPTTAIAYVLDVIEIGTKKASFQFVRPSLARGMFKSYMEEGDQAELTPMTSLPGSAAVRDVWISTSVFLE